MTGVASAQLSEVDLVPGSGDAQVTLDGATGLYWLDLEVPLEERRAQPLVVTASSEGSFRTSDIRRR